MSMSITERLFFPVRHPERSEAKDFLFSQRLCPSAVEGPCRLDSKSTAANSFLSMHSPSRRLSVTTPASTPTVALRPRRSFDFGSARRHGKTHLPLAFAQDDGAFVFFTRFQVCCPPQELGNVERGVNP
jgi:hypothetical protein